MTCMNYSAWNKCTLPQLAVWYCRPLHQNNPQRTPWAKHRGFLHLFLLCCDINLRWQTNRSSSLQWEHKKATLASHCAFKCSCFLGQRGAASRKSLKKNTLLPTRCLAGCVFYKRLVAILSHDHLETWSLDNMIENRTYPQKGDSLIFKQRKNTSK